MRGGRALPRAPAYAEAGRCDRGGFVHRVPREEHVLGVRGAAHEAKPLQAAHMKPRRRSARTDVTTDCPACCWKPALPSPCFLCADIRLVTFERHEQWVTRGKPLTLEEWERAARNRRDTDFPLTRTQRLEADRDQARGDLMRHAWEEVARVQAGPWPIKSMGSA